MTSVDDMLATSPVRSPRSKSSGGAQDADAANQRSAFENAFADAGKKKQPAISINGKAGADGTLPPDQAALQNLKIADAQNAAKDALAGEGGKGPASEEEGLMKSTFGSGALHASLKAAREQGAQATEAAQKFSLRRADGRNGNADTGKTVDGAAADKIADLLKGVKAGAPKHGDKTETAEDASLANPAGDAMPADVSQLLSLLDAAQTPAVVQAGQTEATPVMSEFQALAERAGKAKAKDAISGKADAHTAGDANAVKNATEAGSDQVFRFARADGKGQAVSMSVTADVDKTVIKNDASSGSAKAEAVTVLEARRYLGLAPSSNASAVTSQISNNPEWARTLQSGAGTLASPSDAANGKVLNTLKIQMHPIDLGMVTATLRLKDDELYVELKVESGDAFRQLSDDQGAMIKALRAQGFAVDQVNIVFNASDSSGGNSGQQGQPQAGQQGREAAGDGSAQGRGQRNDNGAQQQAGGGWTGNEGKSDASSGAEPGRTGGVYM